MVAMLAVRNDRSARFSLAAEDDRVSSRAAYCSFCALRISNWSSGHDVVLDWSLRGGGGGGGGGSGGHDDNETGAGKENENQL